MARSPLFDIYDPLGQLQQDYDLGRLPDEDEELDPLGLLPIGRRKPTISDLMPEEEKRSMLQTLASAGSSGLAGLGWLLDTPGAVIRGGLSGGPMKALSALWDNSDERVTGRELLRQYGMVGQEDTWGNFAGSLAAEVVLDPLTWVNPFSILGKGAVGTAGRAAERAGLLDNVNLLANRSKQGTRQFLRENTPRSLIAASDDADAALRFQRAAAGKGLNPDDLMDAPLAGLMEFRVPGMERGALLTGGAVGDALATGLDAVGRGLRTSQYTAPLAGRWTAFWDPTVMGEVDPSKQWRNREAFAAQTKKMRDNRQWVADRTIQANKVTHNGFSFSDPRIQNAIADTIEAKMDPARVASLLDKEAVSALEAVPAWREFRDEMADRLNQARADAQSRGMDVPVAQSKEDVGFFPSQAVWFNNPQMLDLPGWVKSRPNPYTKGARVLNTDDLVGRSRNAYTDLPQRRETFRRLMGGDFGRQLQDRLFGATPEQVPGVLDEAFAALGMDAPYSRVAAEQVTDDAGRTIADLEEFLKDDTLLPSDRKEWGGKLEALSKKQEAANAVAKKERDALKLQLGDLLTRQDRQFSQRNMGLFDNSAVNDMLRYLQGRAVSDANAPIVLDDLLSNALPMASAEVPGRGVKPLLDAAAELGFDKNALKGVLAGRGIANPESLSVAENALQNLKKLAPAPQFRERGPMGRAWDSFTNLFKIGSLANPAYHTRNLYSGQLATLTSGGFDPYNSILDAYAGWQAGKGNYTPAVNRLRTSVYGKGFADDMEGLTDQFLSDAARGNLGSGLAFETDGAIEQATKNLYPGGDTQREIPFFGQGGLFYDPDRSWNDWLTVRGVDALGTLGDRPAPTQTLNPLLDLHERTAKRVEDANRLGAFISALRQGYSPDAAAELVLKTQADYSPRAFGAGEQALKAYVPFYAYQRKIAPLVAENILYRPGGLQGQITRTVTRGGEPSDDNFMPEYLRQSAAVPIPGAPAEGLQRYVTNIDLPWEGLVNLVSPGVGNTLPQVLGDTLKKTGMNLLGQVNPLVKGPLEYILDRQLYSGREMSDLYSALEKDIGPWGRPAEQLLVNMPFGSKANAVYRTLRDDRLSAAEKAVKLLINNTLGAKVTDVDKDKAQRKAARDTLNQLLSITPGVRTYENLTVPEDVLRSMPQDQKDLYLLYKIIQSEAAKRARDKKRAEESALDPLEVLGAIRQA